MTAMGIIFSNIHDRNVAQLTEERTMASVPFGGRYRLIDFVLSNMVNADIEKVGVITKTNYQSLMRHVGSGKDWDLSRKHGGLVVLPPFGNRESGSLYNNRLEALQGIMGFLDDCQEDYVIMADCDIVCNMSYTEVLMRHVESGADITAVYQDVHLQTPINRPGNVLEMDESGRITGLAVYPSVEGDCKLGLNTWVLSKDLLKNIVHDSLARGMTSFSKDVIAPNLQSMKVMGCPFNGSFSCIDSMRSYLASNLKLLRRDVREQLFRSENHPIYTKVKDSPPTKYGAKASASNSIVADGCIIEGTVENSVLFRGVKVGKGTVVRNCVVMQDTVIGENAVLHYVVTDKRVIVRDGRVLSGCDVQPYYIGKGTML